MECSFLIFFEVDGIYVKKKRLHGLGVDPMRKLNEQSYCSVYNILSFWSMYVATLLSMHERDPYFFSINEINQVSPLSLISC